MSLPYISGYVPEGSRAANTRTERESKQVKDKGYVKISTTNNYFGSLRVLYEDLSTILTEELKTIQTLQEKKRHEKLLNKK